jgi:hypothetical protein
VAGAAAGGGDGWLPLPGLPGGMAMIRNGLIDWAKQVPNPQTSKTYAGENAGRNGIFCHSVEGILAGDFIPRAFDPNDNDLSNMFTLKLDGTLCQHFPVTAKCFCSSSKEANSTTWSVEAEGVGDRTKPDRIDLTAAQSKTMQRLFAEWEQYTGLKATRGSGAAKAWPWGQGRLYPVNRTLWQHSEAIATACPSGRYDATFAAWEAAPTPPVEEERVTRAEYEDLLLAMFAGSEQRVPASEQDPKSGQLQTREERLTAALFRAKQRADGKARSVSDVAHSAEFNLAEHIRKHPPGSDLVKVARALDGAAKALTHEANA